MLSHIRICAVVLLLSACTKVAYTGPRRPPSEVAILEAENSFIEHVDGVTGNGVRLELLPGEHSIGIKLNTSGGWAGGMYTSKEAYTVCMKAEAGKTYAVRIDMQGSMWRPLVVERTVERVGGREISHYSIDLSMPCQSNEPVLHGTACSQGNAQSCFVLGESYKEGRGVPQDDIQASRLFEKACQGGLAMGCNSLGVLYKQGRGVTQDEHQAATLFEQACTGKVAEGCFNLGAQHMQGRAVPRDERRAASLFDLACAGKVAQGCVNLGVLYKEGRGVPQDERRAARLFELGCQGGISTACSP